VERVPSPRGARRVRLAASAHFPGCFAISGDVSDVGTQIGVGAKTASQALLDNFVSSADSALPSLEVMTFVVEGAGLSARRR